MEGGGGSQDYGHRAEQKILNGLRSPVGRRTFLKTAHAFLTTPALKKIGAATGVAEIAIAASQRHSESPPVTLHPDVSPIHNTTVTSPDTEAKTQGAESLAEKHKQEIWEEHEKLLDTVLAVPLGESSKDSRRAERITAETNYFNALMKIAESKELSGQEKLEHLYQKGFMGLQVSKKLRGELFNDQ